VFALDGSRRAQSGYGMSTTIGQNVPSRQTRPLTAGARLLRAARTAETTTPSELAGAPATSVRMSPSRRPTPSPPTPSPRLARGWVGMYDWARMCCPLDVSWTMQSPGHMTEPHIPFDVEVFAALHPGIIMFARAALSRHGGAPRSFSALRDGTACPASFSFATPDVRTEKTYEREKIVELGAIVLAGLLLHAWKGKQLTRVCKRGSRVDYFVGENRAISAGFWR
jgi:hypothetical protein